jgi:hypothetical protein
MTFVLAVVVFNVMMLFYRTAYQPNYKTANVTVSAGIFHEDYTWKEGSKFIRDLIEVSDIKNNWECLATEYHISRGKIEDMRPAFSACYS